MRPIVSTINSPSYKLAKELACILTPLAGCTAYCPELHYLCGEDTGLHTTPQDAMVSFDVKKLFTQVPVEALTVVNPLHTEFTLHVVLQVAELKWPFT